MPELVAERGGVVTRERAAELYESLPLPSTSDEHWRFTDLRGFKPETTGAASASSARAAPTVRRA